jgi:hypothetical protein
MGGYGSGRWHGYTKKDSVEDCRVLDVNRWTREGILRVGVHHFKHGQNLLDLSGEFSRLTCTSPEAVTYEGPCGRNSRRIRCGGYCLINDILISFPSCSLD